MRTGQRSDAPFDPRRRCALKTTSHLDNLPDWLRQSWRHYWGETATTAIADLAMTPPPLDISVRTATVDWASKPDATPIAGNSIRRAFDGDPTQLLDLSPAIGGHRHQRGSAGAPTLVLTPVSRLSIYVPPQVAKPHS